jgi:hypothetical protein
VKAAGEAGSSDWSDVWRFSTIVQLPDPVVLRLPADASTVLGDSVLVVWYPAMPEVDRYWLEYSRSSDFSDSYVDSTLADSVATIRGLAHQQTYYWRVRAHNSTGWGMFSDAWSFTSLVTAPNAPLLLLPESGAVQLPVSPTLQWSASPGESGESSHRDGYLTPRGREQARGRVQPLHHQGIQVTLWEESPFLIVDDTLTHHLQISLDSLFGAMVVEDSLIVDTSRQVGPLANRTTYYWRVRTRNAVGASAWSQVWNFRTIAEIPGPTALLSPENGTVVLPDSLAFLWNRGAEEIDRYWFEYSADSGFVLSNVDSMLADTTTVLLHLVPNQNFWWRVRSHNASGWGSFSEVRGFSTLLTGVQEGKGIPEHFSLSQNFPNPFNPSTVIRYALPVDAHVLLEVFNVLGQRVATLVDAQQTTGFHSVILKRDELGDPSGTSPGFASGVYFYRIQAGNGSAIPGRQFVQTKKFILLR